MALSNFPKNLQKLTFEPGVYKMFDETGAIIYIGKARNLKKRVKSYFQKRELDPKTRALVSQIARVEVIVTQSETEALLLEAELIKAHRPKFNIVFRDDKSYPYIFLSAKDKFPRLVYYRGNQTQKGRYFGPYPSAYAVRETLCELQKVFRLRTCDDIFFKNRTRPCLQYQIKRCSAPCVGFIDEATYQEDVQQTVLFLEGKDQQVIEDLIKRMEKASSDTHFELAAQYRDRIYRLQRIVERQHIFAKHVCADVIAVGQQGHVTCVQLLSIRAGRLQESRSYFPENDIPAKPEGLIAAFLEHHYLQSTDLPKEIILNTSCEDKALFEETLGIKITTNARGEKAQWIKLAEKNVEQAIQRRLTDTEQGRLRLQALQAALKISNLPRLMECFDVSHTQGEATVASCVVFKNGVADHHLYRRYNIQQVQAGDDYAALRQALLRRYLKLKEENNDQQLPDLVIIDGGKGQLSQAEAVFRDLQIEGVELLAVAKGVSRKPGEEVLFVSGRSAPLILSPDASALHLIQQIRDEAHRFAITGHRKKRAKARMQSVLEEIPGIGMHRRRILLQTFGGLQGLRQASQEAIAKVPGISRVLAEKIYQVVHK